MFSKLFMLSHFSATKELFSNLVHPFLTFLAELFTRFTHFLTQHYSHFTLSGYIPFSHTFLQRKNCSQISWTHSRFSCIYHISSFTLLDFQRYLHQISRDIFISHFLFTEFIHNHLLLVSHISPT